MADYILDLLNANETVNYSLILSFIAAYIIFMWFIVSIWLFTDAKKRYQSIIQPIFFSTFVLLFGPPALIFYIMIRPEHTLDEDYFINLALSGEKQSRPIYFDGDKGFDINVNLSVQPREVDNDNQHKMNVEVSWMPKDESNKLRGSKAVRVKKSRIIGLRRRLKALTDEFTNTLTGIIHSTNKSSVPEPEIERKAGVIEDKEVKKEDSLVKVDIKKKKKRNKRKKKKRKKRR